MPRQAQHELGQSSDASASTALQGAHCITGSTYLPPNDHDNLQFLKQQTSFKMDCADVRSCPATHANKNMQVLSC